MLKEEPMNFKDLLNNPDLNDFNVLKAGLINESLVIAYVKRKYLVSLLMYEKILLVLGWKALENCVKGIPIERYMVYG